MIQNCHAALQYIGRQTPGLLYCGYCPTKMWPSRRINSGIKAQAIDYPKDGY
jgi:hypothetical protein